MIGRVLPRPSGPARAHIGNEDQAPAVHRSSRHINAGEPLFDLGSGLGLLWPQNDVVLDHAGVEIRLRADDLVLVDRDRPLSLSGPEGWTAQLLDLGARKSLRVGGRRRDLMRPIDGDLPLALFIKRLWRIESELADMAIDSDLIAERLTDVIRMLCGISLTRDGNLSSHKETMLERAEMLIAAQLEQATLSPATLAARMRISTRHLSSLFAAIGTTTTKAILAQRLARARTMLADPANRQRQIAEIAIACGFSDQGYFSRCFRKHSGVTPIVFRRSTNRTFRNIV